VNEVILINVLALLLPIGFALMAAGARPPREAKGVAFAGMLSVAIGVLGYFCCGFAFQFGGIGLVWKEMPGLKNLIWEWSPLDVRWGPGWGALGLYGFFLTGQAASPQALVLFVNQLPLVCLAVFIFMATLWDKVKHWVLILFGFLIAALLHPIVGNWVWGGGWLANLGKNIGLAHGFIDLLGAGSPHLLGALVTLFALLIFRLRSEGAYWELPSMPPVHLPLLAILGSFLTLVGYIALLVGNPIYARLDNLSLPFCALNLLEAAAGGFLAAAIYSLFTTNRSDVFMAIRGSVAGLVAAGASCAFVPLWAGWAIGAGAGLLVPLGIYFFERIAKLDDPAAVLTVNGLGAIWGLVATALFADGSFGQGWNGVPSDYLNVPGQGVSGLLVSPGFPQDFPHQLYAQLAGIGAIIVWVALLSVPLLVICYRLIKAWEEASRRVESAG